MSNAEKIRAKPGLRAVVMVAVLGAAYLFSNFHRLSLSVIGNVIAEDYGLSTLQLGTLGSAIFYSYALMQIPCGFIADKISARKLVTASCAMTALSTVWFSYADSFPALVAARILTGISTAMIYVPALAAIRKQFGDRIFGTMTGVMVAMGQLGSLCASAPLKFLTDRFGWRSTFLMIGGISLVLALAAWLLILEPKAEPAARMQPAKKTNWRAAFTMGGLSIAVWFFITGGTRLSFQSLWGLRFFVQSVQTTASQSSLYLMYISIGCILGSMIFGRVADRIGNIRTVVCSTGLFALLWVALAALQPQTPTWIIFSVCMLMGAAGAGGFTVGFSCIRLFVSKENTGVITGINNCSAFMGSAIFTQLSGSLMGLSPAAAPRGQFQFLFLVFAALSTACAVFVAVANRRVFTKVNR